MSANGIERMLWTVSVMCAAGICWTWVNPVPNSLPENVTSFATADYPAIFDPDALSRAATDVVDGDLFRPERSAPPAAPPAPSAPAAASPPRPRLVLRGVIGGPPWDAIIDGLPGRPAGTVVRDGESVGGFAIRVYSRDTVRVRGADTAWTLILGRA